MIRDISLPSQMARVFPRGVIAFTLIEVLVSCAVLSIMVALLAAAFTNFSGVTASSGKRIETSNQTRTVYDRLAFDLEASIRKAGVDITFLKNQQASGNGSTKNDSLYLLTAARTSDPAARMARIAYEVEEDENKAIGKKFPSLFRVAEPYLWGDNAADIKVTSLAEKQSMGRGVFRFELSFLTTDGRIVANPPASKDLAVVICSTASLDERTLGQMSDSDVARLVAILPDSEDQKLPLATWSPALFTGFPTSVIQSVRFNQRQFYLK